MQNTLLRGFPHIEKPWLKYHAIDFKRKIQTKETIYNNFSKIARQNPDNLAFIDFKTGTKVTYGDLLEQADAFANGLKAMGITSEHKIGVIGFNCLVDPVALLGTNKLGATVVFVDPEGGAIDVSRNTDYLDVLILENIFAEMVPAINAKNMPVIIWGECPFSLRPNCISYDDFIKNDSAHIAASASYVEDAPAVVIFSSGSTGTAKPIVHSNFTVNSAIQKMLYSDFPIDENNFLIKVIPSNIGLGVITTMLTSLIAGVTYIQLKGLPNPAVDLVKDTFDLIVNFKQWLKDNGFGENKGLILFAAPFFAKILASQIDDIDDLSMLKGILLGGAKMPKEDLDSIQEAFIGKGLNVPVCNGYGQNEMAGAVALNTVHHNKNGSAGYPVYGTTVRIVDRYTHEDVPFNTVGQILECSDSKFMYYMGMPEKTEASKIILSDGTEWYDSTDLGYMDEDGFLFITGRTTRVVIKFDHKVSMDVIEEKIRALDFVCDTAVVPLAVEGDVIAFVCTDEQMTEDELIELFKTDKAGLSMFEIPAKVKILDSLPRMNNGKVDYMKLNELAKEIE